MCAAETTSMKLADLAKKSGISVSTLYEYLRSGILHPPERISPTKTAFNQSHLGRLKEVRFLRDKKKLSLSQIRDQLARKAEECHHGESDADIKTQIIDTALILFSRTHYDKTKISDITKALDMGNGTFYRYFSSKEELFLHCLERLPKKMVSREAWNEVKRETDYITRLRKRGNAMLEAFHSYIGMLNHTKLVLGGEDKLLAAKAAECLRSLSAPLRKDLELAMAQGQIAPIDPDILSYLLLGINETFGHRLLMDKRYTVATGFDIIETFLRRALTTPPCPLSFQVTLTCQTKMELSGLSLNGEALLSGDHCGGLLRIPFTQIAQATFTHKPQGSMVRILTTEGEEVELALAKDLSLEGSKPFGSFCVTIEKVASMISLS